MSASLRRPIALVLLMALITFECVRGLVPAWSRIDTDFPNYLTAAKIVADGRDSRRLYDDAWFREQMRSYGMQGVSSFAPFPPPTALVLLPLAHLQPLTALRVMTVVNVLCLILAAVLLARILAWSVPDAAAFVLLSGIAIIACLRFGQLYIVISTCCILGYWAYLRRRYWLAGICFGLFAPIKYFPLIFPACLGARRHWRVVLGTVFAILAVAFTSVAVLGWGIHETFLRSVMGHHLLGHPGQQDPFAAAFQSFDSLSRRLFVRDPVLNPHPFVQAPLVRVISLVVTKVVCVLAAALALIRLAPTSNEAAVAPSVGILGILVMLIAPATATYHFILLWLPVGLLIEHFLRQGARLAAYGLLALYSLIGFFPYKFTYPFEGHGGLTVLAYPRLLLVAAMFILCVWVVLARGTATELKYHQFRARLGMGDLHPGGASATQTMLAWLAEHRVRRVLEVGAGIGNTCARMAALGWQVTAIEPDPVLFAKLQQRCGAAARQESFLEHATRDPYDAIVAESVLFQLDLPQAFAHARTLLKPGGYLAFVEAVWTERTTAAQSHEMHDTTERLFGIPVGSREPLTWREWSRRLQDAGFETVHAELLPHAAGHPPTANRTRLLLAVVRDPLLVLWKARYRKRKRAVPMPPDAQESWLYLGKARAGP